ncbi:hypothetical protein JW978_03960 [Candidatus Dojkabacteria bacterium]|nr:hypothetical protein [Candidatus Dojkabacteria bacterium]
MDPIPKLEDRSLLNGELLIVPGMQDVDIVLDKYSNTVRDRINEISTETGRMPTLVVPLNGGVVPALYVLKDITADNLPNIIFAAKLPDDAQSREGDYFLDSSVDPNGKFLVLDDIADKLLAYKNIRNKILSGGNGDNGSQKTTVELFAVTEKFGTDALKDYPSEIHATRTIPDIKIGGQRIPPWIRAGFGMNAGNTSNPELEARQRLAKSCYFVPGADQVLAQGTVNKNLELEMLRDPNNLCLAASDQRFRMPLDDGSEAMGPVELLTRLEILRRSGDVSGQFELARRYFDAVLC